ncbi:MAG TPA: hypothetical protein VGY58_01835 [Gemmataceae bacterium]|jgi:hypothetical protein|nr:hypothetical protein [Gemmataceae bacterium]
MRLTQLTSLVLLALLASGSALQAGRLRIPGHPPAQSAKARGQQQTHSWIVPGFGVRESDAMQDGLRRARETVVSYLADQGVYLNWDLPASYIEKHMVKNVKPAEDKDVGVAGIEPVKQMDLYVELSPRDYQYFMKRESELRGQERMTMLGKVLAGVIAFLAVVAGYFRLEEATKGYYTAWLRIGVLTLVAAIGAGLWLLS